MASAHWDRYAQVSPSRRLINAAGATTWFNWTQYPDHGPGLEVLNLPYGARVLDLGCGKGGNIAYVTATGHQGIGIDIAPLQIAHARTRWPGLHLVCGDALTYLEEGGEPFDAMYSVFGALWFVDPDVMLPAVHRRLRGTLAFSYTPMRPISGLPRWDFEPEEWAARLDKRGFIDIETREVPPPSAAEHGHPTFLVRARTS